MRRMILLILMLFPWVTLYADPFFPFQPKWQNQVKIAGPGMDRPENRGKEFYSEWWAGVFRLKKGYYLYLRFMVYNLGPGDRKLKVKVEFDTPDGQKYKVTRKFDHKEWRSGKGLSITADGNELRFDGKDFIIRLKNKYFTGDIRIRPRFSAWKPGNGRIRYGKGNDYYDLDIPLPLGDLNGVFTTLKDNRMHSVSGVAYIDHQAMNAGMHVTTHTMYRFRKVDSKKVVFLAALTPPPQYGSKPATCMVMFLPGHRVIQAVGLKLTVKSWWTDPKEGGYKAPKVLVFTGKSSDGKPIRGAVVMKKLDSRDDFLKSMNRVERFIVSKFAKPISYDFDAVFAVEVGTGDSKFSLKTNGDIFFTGVNH